MQSFKTDVRENTHFEILMEERSRCVVNLNCFLDLLAQGPAGTMGPFGPGQKPSGLQMLAAVWW